MNWSNFIYISGNWNSNFLLLLDWWSKLAYFLQKYYKISKVSCTNVDVGGIPSLILRLRFYLDDPPIAVEKGLADIISNRFKFLVKCFAVGFIINYVTIIYMWSTKALYLAINNSLAIFATVLVLFTLVVITFKFSSKENWVSWNIIKTQWSVRLFLLFLLKKISWARLLWSGLKLIFLWKAHLLIWYRSYGLWSYNRELYLDLGFV